MGLTTDQMVDMLRRMWQIRFFEQNVIELFKRGLHHTAHACFSGEEATAVGACAALRTTDFITSTHRGHGHCIAKGGELKPMMAELLGKANGYCGGKGGSMHIADMDLGILGANVSLEVVLPWPVVPPCRASTWERIRFRCVSLETVQ